MSACTFFRENYSIFSAHFKASLSAKIFKVAGSSSDVRERNLRFSRQSAFSFGSLGGRHDFRDLVFSPAEFSAIRLFNERYGYIDVRLHGGIFLPDFVAGAGGNVYWPRQNNLADFTALRRHRRLEL